MPAPSSFSAFLFGLSGCLVDFGARTQAAANQSSSASNADLLGIAQAQAVLTPGADAALHQLQAWGTPCAWLDALPAAVCSHLASPLPTWLVAAGKHEQRPWPAPDACWQALIDLQVPHLDGAVLVSGDPQLLQAGLNAGLWTIGLAICGSLCGQSLADWQRLDDLQRERLRTDATLSLYRLGVHAVIDQLDELDPALHDVALRRQKGEKP